MNILQKGIATLVMGILGTGCAATQPNVRNETRFVEGVERVGDSYISTACRGGSGNISLLRESAAAEARARLLRKVCPIEGEIIGSEIVNAGVQDNDYCLTIRVYGEGISCQ